MGERKRDGKKEMKKEKREREREKLCIVHLPSRQSTFFGQVSSLFLPVCFVVVVVVVVVLPTQNAGALMTGLVLASQVFHFQFSVFHSPRDLVSNTVVSSMIDIC
jgi:ABC-type sugar transport system permease subunit